MSVSFDQIEAWLQRWALAIRQGDYATGRELFANDVVAFGTLTGTMVGIDALIAEQWSKIWPRTQNFAFLPPHLLVAEGSVAVAAIEWRSEGSTGGSRYRRHGRATLMLRAEGEKLVCIHSHLSMLPGTPALADER